MKGSYLLKWFDDLVTDTLNPNGLAPNSVSKAQTSSLVNLVIVERKSILGQLTFSLFCIKKEESIRLLVRNYYSVLQILIKTCVQYESREVFTTDENLQTLLLEAKSNIQQIFDFIVSRFSYYLPVDSRNKELSSPTKMERPQKINLRMSVDQVSIIIRAAFDNHIIPSKSMTDLYRNIAPYISTNQSSDISFQSLRTKAYNAETPDKEFVISALSSLIESIKGY